MGSTGNKLKRACIRRKASPILFANSLPIGIRSFIVNKLPERGTVTAEVACRHIEDVFALDHFISRVRIAIMSGLSANVFETSRHTIRAECASRSIHVTEVPFFFGPNKAKINAVLTDLDRARLSDVVSSLIT